MTNLTDVEDTIVIESIVESIPIKSTKYH